MSKVSPDTLSILHRLQSNAHLDSVASRARGHCMSNRLGLRLGAIALLLALLSPTQLIAGGTYVLASLPSISNELEAYAAGINNSGQVVGHVIDPFGHAHAAYWGGDGKRLLPELDPSAPFSHAYRINDSGQIVGKAGAADGSVHATMWNGLDVIDIGTLSGAGDSFAADINEQGVVAGSSSGEVGTHAFTWTEAGGFVDYGNTNPPFRLAVAGFNGINNQGLMVGTSYIILEPYRAAFAHEGDKALADLSPPGRNSVGMAMAVNDAGTIVGFQSGDYGSIQATIFREDGSFDQLGALGLEESWALDVNQANEIVGRAFAFGPNGLITKAFVADGRDMLDILENSSNPDGWLLVEATAINDHGVIVGNGLFQGEPRAFIATPVPEPSSVILVASAGIALCGSGRRVRRVARRQARPGENRSCVH